MGVPGFRNPENLRPFAKGNQLARRSNATDKALRSARKLTPEAIRYTARVMRDDEADPRLRLKAAEIILLHGMPKGTAHQRALEAIDGGVNSLRVEFVAPDGSTVSFEQQAALPVFDVPFEDADMDSAADAAKDVSNSAANNASTDE